MADQELSRKLAVIVHADVVDSTALVKRNETLAHKLINEAFQRFSSIIQEYGGTVHEIRGDALVAEFARASDAVCAALRFQQFNTARNTSLSSDMMPVVRVGIALGEEVFAHNTVTGAGVVLAQRVEQLSEPGGVCVTGAIHEAIPQRLPFDQESLGEQTLKGFDEPVRVYRVALKAGAAVPGAETGRQMRSPLQRWRLALVFAAVALVVIGGVVFWLQPWAPKFETASVERMTFPLPDKPSIAVLPFVNLSDEPHHDTFADGLSENVITMLSKIPNMFVIARSSTFTYKGKPVKVQQVAEELGVRFVLEGSIQRSGDRARISAQLVDALTGRQVWAEQYERGIKDVFALQDDITQEVVTALQVKLTEGEQARVWRGQTSKVEAYEHYLRGLESWRRFTKADNDKAQQLFEKAVTVDPNFAAAWVELARTYYLAARFGWSDEPDKATARAAELAAKAVAIDDSQADAYAMLSNVALLERHYDEAVTYCEKALSLHPGAEATAHCARNFSYVGRPRESLELIKRAMRLSPYYPSWYLVTLGTAYRLMGDYPQAISAMEKWRDREPDTALAHITLAVTFEQAGREQEARAAVAEALRRDPRFSIKQFARAMLYKDPAETKRILDALRKAGVPETRPL